MTQPCTRKLRTRPKSILLVLAALAWLGFPLAGQDEWAKRDAWQLPAEVMDALGIRAGSVVADVGAGNGYFTFRLASRVGPQGKVYAEDIRDEELAKIRERAKKEGVAQIETILGTPNDPRLPAESLDAILVVNAYHEMKEYDAMLGAMFRALKPGGLLAIIDARAKPGKPRQKYFDDHIMPEQLVREDAARNSFHFLRKEPGFKNSEGKREYYFLIFEKSRAAGTSLPRLSCVQPPLKDLSQTLQRALQPTASPPVETAHKSDKAVLTFGGLRTSEPLTGVLRTI